MDRRHPIRVGDLVWYDDYIPDDERVPYDGRNGKFALLVEVLPSRVTRHEIAIVEGLSYGTDDRGGRHTILADRLYKAHWTFIGPVCLEWPKYPLRFVGA